MLIVFEVTNSKCTFVLFWPRPVKRWKQMPVFDLSCLCQCSATLCPSLTNLEGEETFEATMLGQAEEVVQERICDDELILVKK